MGRPPLDPGEAKDQVYQLRLTAAEREHRKPLQSVRGKTLSDVDQGQAEPGR